MSILAKIRCGSILYDLSFHNKLENQPGEIPEEQKNLNRRRDKNEDIEPPRYIRIKPEKRSCECGKKTNRHENLFPGGRKGIYLTLLEMQLVLYFSLLCLITLIFYGFMTIRREGHWGCYIVCIVNIMIFFYCSFYVIPDCLGKYMLITNVWNSIINSIYR